MILDNENENLKVHEWITKYTEEGKLDIVVVPVKVYNDKYNSKLYRDK